MKTEQKNPWAGAYHLSYDHEGAWIEGAAGRIRAKANPDESEQELRFINRVHKTARETARG